MMSSLVAALCVLVFVSLSDGQCCPKLSVYAPLLIDNGTARTGRVLQAEGDGAQLSEREVQMVDKFEQVTLEAEGKVNVLLEQLVELEDLVIAAARGGEQASSSKNRVGVEVSEDCLAERAKLISWQNFHDDNWRVQNGFHETEFTRTVVDFMQLGRSDYWEANSVPEESRVLAIRTLIDPTWFNFSWYTGVMAAATEICQDDVDNTLADLKNALSLETGSVVLLVDEDAKAAWDTWLTTSFGESNTYRIAIVVYSGDLQKDVIDGMAKISEDFEECEICYEAPNTCCGQSFIVAGNFTPDYDVDYFGMYRRLEDDDSQDTCSSRRVSFETPIEMMDGDYYWYRGAVDENIFTRFFYDFTMFPGKYWKTEDGSVIADSQKILVINVDYSPDFIALYDLHDSVEVTSSCAEGVNWLSYLLIQALRDRKAHAVILTSSEYEEAWRYWVDHTFPQHAKKHGCGTGCMMGTAVYTEGDFVGSVFKGLSKITLGSYSQCSACVFTSLGGDNDVVSTVESGAHVASLSLLAAALLLYV